MSMVQVTLRIASMVFIQLAKQVPRESCLFYSTLKEMHSEELRFCGQFSYASHQYVNLLSSISTVSASLLTTQNGLITGAFNLLS